MTSSAFLIIYELVPDDTFVFFVPAEDATFEIRSLVKIAGKFMNCDELTEEQEEIHTWLGCAVCKNPEYANNDGAPGKLRPYLVSDRSGAAITADIDGTITVVHTGFFL